MQTLMQRRRRRNDYFETKMFRRIQSMDEDPTDARSIAVTHAQLTDGKFGRSIVRPALDHISIFLRSTTSEKMKPVRTMSSSHLALFHYMKKNTRHMPLTYRGLTAGRRKSTAKKKKTVKRKSIAKKKDTKLWEDMKELACKRFPKTMCKHSARKMQLATKYYKEHGGRYEGEKSETNSLSKWTRQKWRTSDGKPSEGKRRYLPTEAWKHLTKDEIRRTNAAKRKGKKQYVKQPKDIARKTRKYRETTPSKRVKSPRR